MDEMMEEVGSGESEGKAKRSAKDRERRDSHSKGGEKEIQRGKWRSHLVGAHLVELAQWLIVVGLAMLPVYAAWDQGGVWAWSRWVISVGVSLLLLVSLPLFVVTHPVRTWRVLVVPSLALLVFGVGLTQRLNFPGTVAGWVSPGVATAYEDWVPEWFRQLPSENQAESSATSESLWYPLTVDAALTADYLVMPGCFAASFLLAAVTIRKQKQIVLILGITMASGAVFTFLGITDAIQPPSINGSDDSWITPSGIGTPFGPFVNRNNAAGYLNLCLAASVGCLVYASIKSQNKLTIDERFQIVAETWWQRPLYAMQSQIRALNASKLGLIVVIGLIFSGILLSGSRGGFLGAAGGTLLTVFLTGRKNYGLAKSLIVVCISLLSLGILGLIGMTDYVSARLETLWNSTANEDARLEHWHDGLVAAWNYFPMGSGLGTYRYAYLPYQSSSTDSWFLNADGMHIEFLVEGGVWLLPLIAIGLVVILGDITRIARKRNAPQVTALTAAAYFAIGSTLVSQLFDFGITLPPFYITLAILLGAVAGTTDRFASDRTRSARSRYRDLLSKAQQAPAPVAAVQQTISPQTGLSRERALPQPGRILGKTDEKPSWKLRLASWTLFVATTAALGLSIQFSLLTARHEGLTSRDVESLLNDYRNIGPTKSPNLLASQNETTSRPSAIDAVDEAGTSATDVHQSAEYHLRVTELLLQLHRESVRLSPIESAGISDETLASYASIDGRRLVYHKLGKGKISSFADVLLPGQSADILVLAKQHAAVALTRCPLSPEARFRLIELDFVEPDSTSISSELLEQIGVLRCRNGRILLLGARLALISPGAQAASPLVRQALQVNPLLVRPGWEILKAGDNLAAALRGVPDIPQVIVSILESDQSVLPSVKADLIKKGNDLLRPLADGDRSIDFHDADGRLAVIQEDWGRAARSFEQAVDLNPSDTEARYRWALALDKAGNRTLAQEQLERCLLQAPNNRHYSKTAREWNTDRN